MGINRFFLGQFNAKVLGEEVIEKENKAFNEILQEEQDKLLQLIAEMGKKWNTEDICRKYNLKAKSHLPSKE